MITNACELEKGELIDAQSIKGVPVDDSLKDDGKVLAYDLANDKLIYVNQSGGGGGVSTFKELTDTPNSYLGQSQKKLVVNSTETGIEFIEDTPVPTSFTSLTDTPNSYTGQLNKILKPNSTLDGLDFYSPRETKKIFTTFTNIDSVDLSVGSISGSNFGSDMNLFANSGDLIKGVTSGALAVYISSPSSNTILVSKNSELSSFVVGEKIEVYDEVKFSNQLKDVPNPQTIDINNNRILALKSDGDGFEFVDKRDNFTELLDTPSTYTGQAKKVLRVNETETAVEFVDTVTEELSRLKVVSRIDQPITSVAEGVILTAEVIKEQKDIVITNGEVTFNFGGTYDFSAFLNITTGGGTPVVLETFFEYYDTVNLVWVKFEDSAQLNTIESNTTVTVEYYTLFTIPDGFKIRLRARTQSGTATADAQLLANGVNVPSVLVTIGLRDVVSLGQGTGGATTFKGLTDTPSDYVGQAGKFVKVNSTENGLEFVTEDIPTNTSDLVNDSNFVVDSNYVHTDNNYTTTEKNKLAGIEANAEVNNISDTNAIALTSLGNTALHYHTSDRDRANHTGTQTANTISDFQATVSANTDVVNNTAKVSFPEAPLDGKQYARQSGNWTEVTGGGGGGITISYLPITTASITVDNFAQGAMITSVGLRPASALHGTSIRLQKLDDVTYNAKVEIILNLDTTFVIPSGGATISLGIDMGTGTTLDYTNGESFNNTYNRSNIVGELGIFQGVSLVLNGGILRGTIRVPKAFGGKTVSEIFSSSSTSIFFNHTWSIG